jgi:hypothetical protein
LIARDGRTRPSSRRGGLFQPGPRIQVGHALRGRSEPDHVVARGRGRRDPRHLALAEQAVLHRSQFRVPTRLPSRGSLAFGAHSTRDPRRAASRVVAPSRRARGTRAPGLRRRVTSSGSIFVSSDAAAATTGGSPRITEAGDLSDGVVLTPVVTTPWCAPKQGVRSTGGFDRGDGGVRVAARPYVWTRSVGGRAFRRLASASPLGCGHGWRRS